MIHYQRIGEVSKRLDDIAHELEVGFSAERETNLFAEKNELESELETLQNEQDEYRDGYDAGREYHMGSGVMRDEWQGRFGAFRQGFDAAGQDS